MYSFLIPADYRKQIQDANLAQIISNDQSILESAQLAGEGEAKSYLRQKYDVDMELAATRPWDPTKIYNADVTVYLTAFIYDATKTYAVNDLVYYAQVAGVYKVYICITAVGIVEAFDPSKWTAIGLINQIYYGKLPAPLFNYVGVYKKGNIVFWKNNTYTCAQDSTIITPDTQFQQGFISQTPVANVFPDDPVNGVAFWGTPTPYSIAAGTLPTDATNWVVGDNRDQQMVLYFIDITLYHVHSRLSPRNIPELRVERYKAAIRWLKMCADGDVTPELPLIQPKQGGRIRFGGNPKAQNAY